MRPIFCDPAESEEDTDRTFTSTDPIIVEMIFTVDDLPSGRKGTSMSGRAYPGVSSGSRFGHYEPMFVGDRSLKERIDAAIASQVKWLSTFYPLRPLVLKVTRPDKRQLTLDEVA